MEERSSEHDIDSLLQSHDDTDSDDDHHHRRTVDEILLTHSPSPSPPSDNVVSPPELSHSLSTSAVESTKFNDFTTTTTTSLRRLSNHNNSRTKSVDEIPQFFGNRLVRSNAKPGAALAAATAASRSVPSRYRLNKASSVSSQKLVLVYSNNANSIDSEESTPTVSRDFDAGSSGYGANHEGSSSDDQLDLKASDFQSEEVGIGVELARGDVSRVLTSGETLTEIDDFVEEASTRHFSENDVGLIVVDDEEKSVSSTASGVPHLGLNEDYKEDGQILGLSLNNSDNNGDINAAFESYGQNNEKASPVLISDEGSDTSIDMGGEPAENGDHDASPAEESAANIVEDFLDSQKTLSKLELAEEVEKKQAFKGMHYEEGAAAQPMRLEGLRRDSTPLGYFDVSSKNPITWNISSQSFRRDHGSPLVLAVHLNYIALGMSKGTIVVIPSKYTPHQVDKMDGKMSMLGLQGDRSNVPVTSMCFNQQGELLFAGYGDGHYTVWDVQRTSALKVVSEHKAPVVHMLYLEQDSESTTQFNVVSGDSKGVFKLIRFKVFPWLNMISYSKITKLLDETTSKVVCASPLLSGEGQGDSQISSQNSSVVSTDNSMTGSVVEDGVVVLISHQAALVAKVYPDVEVYAQIPKPGGIRENAMPYAAWRCMSQSLVGSSNEGTPVEASSDRVSLLALAWDEKVQIARLVKSKLKVFEKWTLESPAVGLAWLDDQMLVVLASNGLLYLFSKNGNVIHQTSFAVDGFRGDGLISYHIYFSNTFVSPEKAYHNSVAVRGATIYILGKENLTVCRFLPWKDRIGVLRKAGDWMGALNMAVMLFDGELHGVIDLPKNLDDIQRCIMPYLVELLQSYVSEVFSYILIAYCNQNGKLDQSEEIKEQYTRVGGVAVEFCVHIRRTDVLFDEVLSEFEKANQKETFLELLEPYILKDMLGSLPPAIMQALVEHYSERGWLERIEQCVLHMDIMSLDFNQVVRLCREHRLHGALIYLFNRGLDDFRTPLEELLVVFRNSERKNAASLGYRMLVYLKYCFQGLAFPPGHGNLSPTRVPSLRKELLQFLLEDSVAPSSLVVTSLLANGAFPNMLHLLQLDTEATLDVLRIAFMDSSSLISGQPLNLSLELAEVRDSMSSEIQVSLQKVVDVLAIILATSYVQTDGVDDCKSSNIWPSKEDVGRMYEFIAYYVACERANVNKNILSQILGYLASEMNISHDLLEQKTGVNDREKQLLALLEVVPQTHWDISYLLHLCEKAQFHQVCGYIHAVSGQHVSALDSYMKAKDEPAHAFSFIHDMLRQLRDTEFDAFESAVVTRIPSLVKLSREGTYFLILDQFPVQNQHVLSELHSHPESLFLYLKTVFEVHSTGRLDFSCLKRVKVSNCFSGARRARKQSAGGIEAYFVRLSSFPTLVQNNSIQVTDEMTELYFELLCRYERESVLKFLETSDSYRVERCLQLCQEYDIVDAAAFLLERVGDVGSALLVILSTLNDKFTKLNAAIEAGTSELALLKKKEVIEILDVVRSCIGLCQRNSPRLDPEESEYLWFQLLDSFCKPLMDSNSRVTYPKKKSHRDEEGRNIKWKVSGPEKNAQIITRKLFSLFIKEIVEGMVGYVRLPQIMLKLLADNGNQEFGDFKTTILGMLGRYDFERRILDAAKNLIEDDTYYTMSLLRKGASHGYALRSLVCCMCNSVLSKNSSDSSIQVFSCGHAIHVQCGIREDGVSFKLGSSAGCPICMPRKKTQRSSWKSVLAENGLVSKHASRSQQAHGAIGGLHSHDYDMLERSYASYPVSRFELLNHLKKNQKLVQIESMPLLRLAPPAVYHEKVKKGTDLLAEKPSRNKQILDIKVKGSSVRFPLKSNIFGKEKHKR